MRLFILPLVVMSLAFAALSATAETAPVQPEVKFGATETLSGVFFSNFENRTFHACGSLEACKQWWVGDEFTLECEKDACASLNEKVRALGKPEDYTVWLYVTLVGQKSLEKAKPKFLGDPGRVIRVERIETIDVFPTPQ